MKLGIVVATLIMMGGQPCLAGTDRVPGREFTAHTRSYADLTEHLDFRLLLAHWRSELPDRMGTNRDDLLLASPFLRWRARQDLLSHIRRQPGASRDDAWLRRAHELAEWTFTAIRIASRPIYADGRTIDWAARYPDGWPLVIGPQEMYDLVEIEDVFRSARRDWIERFEHEGELPAGTADLVTSARTDDEIRRGFAALMAAEFTFTAHVRSYEGLRSYVIAIGDSTLTNAQRWKNRLGALELAWAAHRYPIRRDRIGEKRITARDLPWILRAIELVKWKRLRISDDPVDAVWASTVVLGPQEIADLDEIERVFTAEEEEMKCPESSANRPCP